MTEETVTNCNALKPVRCGCGGEAILKHYCYSYGDDDQYYYVWCERCDIQTKTYSTEAEAIQAWNRAIGITHERAVDYLQSTGWMQDHDRQMAEMGKRLEHTYQVGENWYCENCGQQLNAYSWETPQNLAELGNENAQVSEVTSQNDEGTWQKTERTAKAIEHDASITDTDGYKYHRSEYLCGACKKKVLGGDDYCSHCGSKLIWEEEE